MQKTPDTFSSVVFAGDLFGTGPKPALQELLLRSGGLQADAENLAVLPVRSKSAGPAQSVSADRVEEDPKLRAFPAPARQEARSKKKGRDMRAPGSHENGKCRRLVSDREIPVAEAGFDSLELSVLAISRFYFQSFAIPESQMWMRALEVARDCFGEARGGELGNLVLDMVQAMRLSRRSGFRFSNPGCACCSQILSENERQMMGVFIAVRHGLLSQAHAHAMILCEGNDTVEFLAAMTDLCERVLGSDKKEVAAEEQRTYAG